MTTAQQRTDAIVDSIRQLIDPGDIVELRALGVKQREWKPHTVSGFYDYDHLGDLADKARALTLQSKGVYWTLNPVNRDLLSRRCNRAERADDGATDADIVRRRWLLVDADPVRIADISANEAEEADAHDVMEAARQWLASAGWADPVIADSGNGWHLLYRIDLPADDGGIVKRCLQALAKRFDSDSVKVDTTVNNPSRICKLYGTLARKGDSTKERPHRLARIVEMPSTLIVTPEELLLDLAGPAEAVPASNGNGHQNGNGHACNGASKPRSRRRPSGGQASIADRARKYLAKVPAAISGQGGHNATYHAACVLVRGFDLSPDDALPILSEWNATCQPPWTEGELRHKLADAREKAEGEIGYLLDAPAPSSSTGIAALPVGPDNRPKVYVLPDEYLTNNDAAAALEQDLTLYQQAGMLVQIVRNAEFRDGIMRPEGTPKIAEVTSWNLRDRLTARCRFVKVSEGEDGPVETAVNPPEWAVRGVMARGSWPAAHGPRLMARAAAHGSCRIARPPSGRLDPSARRIRPLDRTHAPAYRRVGTNSGQADARRCVEGARGHRRRRLRFSV